MSKGSIVKGRTLLVDGKPFFLRGADFHYFRVPRDQWDTHLKRTRLAGVNTITSCMSWHLHEPEEGRFEFRGETVPERDLVGLLDLVHAHGMRMIVHPGPWMNCEFRNGGVPTWLFEKYPETLSCRADGAVATGRPIPAEGEPVYRRFARKWYEQVVPIFAERQADRGGPVILFQPDNELSAAWSYGLQNSLYDPTVLKVHWPQWLKRAYGTIKRLNTLYGAHYTSFTEVPPPRNFPRSPAERPWCQDWLQFKRYFFSDWGATLAGWARDLGMNTPFIFNEPVSGFYNHGDHSGFGAVLRDRGLPGMTVYHAYTDRICDLDGLFNSLLGLKLASSSPWVGPPMAVEVNNNWFIPRLSRSPINLAPVLKTSLAHGMRGYAMFPFSECVTDLEDSINGPEYFQGTCLDTQARPTRSLPPVEQFNRLVQTWDAELATLLPTPDVTLAYSPSLRTVDFLGAQSCLEKGARTTAAPGGQAFDAEPALNREALSASHDWLDGYETVSKQTTPAEAGSWVKFKEAFILFTRLNFQFDLLDLAHPAREPGSGWLFVPCTGTMDREGIDYLLRHMDAGGGCVFFPTIPVWRTSGEPDTRIGDRLGIQLVEQVAPAGAEILRYGTEIISDAWGRKLTEPGWIFLHKFPEDAHVLATWKGRPVAARSGRAVVSGMDARFMTPGSAGFWENVVRDVLGVKPALQVRGAYYYAALLGTARRGFITVVNVNGDNIPGEISLRGGPTFSVELGPVEARTIPIGIKLDGAPLAYSTSELIRAADGRSFEVCGHPGTAGQLAFSSPVKIEWNGRPRALKERDGLFMLTYRHGIKPSLLRITGVPAKRKKTTSRGRR